MATFISEHDVTIVHVPGKSKMHSLADDLSRSPTLMSPIPTVNSFKREKGANYANITTNTVNLISNEIGEQPEEDPGADHNDFPTEYDSPDRDDEDPVQRFALQGNADVMFQELRGEIPLEVILNIQNIHNDYRGHLGIDKTVDAYKLEYGEINNLKQFVKKYIKACPTCLINRNMHKARPPLERHSVYATRGPFVDVTIDFISGFRESNGFKKICIIVCAFTRYTVAYGCVDETAETAAHCLELFSSYFRTPKFLRSDRGPAFTSDVINAYCKARNITQQLTVPHTPTSHGIVERAIQELLRHLRAICSALEDIDRDQWSSYLHLATGIINQTCHYSTGYPPAVLVFGSSTFDSPQAIADLLPANFEDAKQSNQSLADHANRLRALWNASTQFQDTEAINHMKEQNSFQGLEVGSYALVKNHIGLSKVDPKFLGPFEVLGQRDDGNEHIFELRDLVQDTIQT